MGDLVEGHDVSLELAERIIAAVKAESERCGFCLSICVADRAGNPVATARMDGALLGSYAIACDKAFSSAIWQDRTGEMGKITVPGEGDWGINSTFQGRMIVFAGGVPIRKDGVCIGGLGVSGALSAEDEAVALAALASLGLEDSRGMDIVLVRHAIAEERDASRWPDDALRPLTAFGRERFAPAARGLGIVVGRVERVLASPYARAWETARILSDQADWPEAERCDALAAHATVGDALRTLVALADHGTIACVGHEPNLTLLAQELLRAKDAGDVPWFKKGGALCVRFRGSLDPGRGRLLWARAPKELRRLGG